MHITKKEFEAIHAAIDFIENRADGADEDKYPHDVLDGLRSVFNRYKEHRFELSVKYKLKKIIKQKKVSTNQ